MMNQAVRAHTKGDRKQKLKTRKSVGAGGGPK